MNRQELWDYELKRISDEATKDSPIHSNPHDLRRLDVDSLPWRDIRAAILDRILVVRDELEVLGREVKPDGTVIEHDMRDVAYHQGQLSILRLLLDLPEKLAMEKEQQLASLEEHDGRREK